MRVHGFTRVERDGAFRIVPVKLGLSENGRTAVKLPTGPPEGEVIVSQLVRPDHVDAASLASPLKPLIHPWGAMTVHGPSNALIITDAAVTIEKVLVLIHAMDQPLAPPEWQVVNLKYADGATAAKMVSGVFAAFNANKRKEDIGVKVFPDPSGSMLVVTAPKAIMQKVVQFIRKLDRHRPVREGNLHLYYPKHVGAKVIADILNGLLSKSAQASAGKRTALDNLGKVGVVGEETTNSLVVAATPEDYAVLRPIIEGLDIMPFQVHVEALIVEATSDHAVDFGVEWRFTKMPTAGSRALTPYGGTDFGTINNPLAVTGGLLVGLMQGTNNGIPNLGLLLQALQQDSNINILATPNLMTMDNQEAKIVVGKNVPIRTGSQTTSGGVVQTSIERRDVGLTLKITPHVMDGGWLKLQIYQEQSSLAPSIVVGQNEQDLVTRKRSIETVVVVKSGQVIVLGGLITEEHSEAVSSVPCLGGGLPPLDELFKQTSRSANKSNLMVFIKPVLVDRAADFLGISAERYHPI